MAEEKTAHRWLVVIGGLLIIMCLGVAYSWGVFLTPIANEFGWSSHISVPEAEVNGKLHAAVKEFIHGTGAE